MSRILMIAATSIIANATKNSAKLAAAFSLHFPD